MRQGDTGARKRRRPSQLWAPETWSIEPTPPKDTKAHSIVLDSEVVAAYFSFHLICTLFCGTMAFLRHVDEYLTRMAHYELYVCCSERLRMLRC